MAYALSIGARCDSETFTGDFNVISIPNIIKCMQEDSILLDSDEAKLVRLYDTTTYFLFVAFAISSTILLISVLFGLIAEANLEGLIIMSFFIASQSLLFAVKRASKSKLKLSL